MSPERTRPGPDQDRMLDLLHGLLPDEERSEVLEQIAADPEAERTLQQRAAARERARAAGAPRLRDTAPSSWARVLAALRNPSPGALVGAGAAALVVGVLLRAGGPGVPEGPAFRALPSDPVALQLRSAEGQLPAAVTAGLEAYAAGDWARAAETLAVPAQGATDETTDIVRRVYLGSALAMAGRPAEALDILEDLPLEILPEPWSSEGRWTRALALRRLGRDGDATAELERLAGETGDAAERARALLAR